MLVCDLSGRQNKTAITFYSINSMVSISEAMCIYCAVRSECLSTLHVKFRLQRDESWSRCLFECLKLWRPGFDPWPIHVRFVMDKVTLGAFAKLRNSTICFVMSVCPSVLAPHGTTRLPLDGF